MAGKRFGEQAFSLVHPIAELAEALQASVADQEAPEALTRWIDEAIAAREAALSAEGWSAVGALIVGPVRAERRRGVAGDIAKRRDLTEPEIARAEVSAAGGGADQMGV